MQPNQSKYKFNNFFSSFYIQPTAEYIYLHDFRFLSFVIFVKQSNRNQNIFFIHFWFLQHFNLNFIIIFSSKFALLLNNFTIRWLYGNGKQQRHQSQRNFTKSEYIVIQFDLI